MLPVKSVYQDLPLGYLDVDTSPPWPLLAINDAALRLLAQPQRTQAHTLTTLLSTLTSSDHARIEAQLRQGKDGSFEICLAAPQTPLAWRHIQLFQKKDHAQLIISDISSIKAESEQIQKEHEHRIKNNFQSLISILELESTFLDSACCQSLIKDHLNYIQTYMDVNRLACYSDTQNGIDFNRYLTTLCQHYQRQFSREFKSANLRLDCPALLLDSKTTSVIGIILSELMINTSKHAFNVDHDNQLFIQVSQDHHQLSIQVQDNGPGLPEHINIESAMSFGLCLIRSSITQLSGQLQYEYRQGSHFQLLLPIHPSQSSN
ncbi:MAG: hypothetical protein CL521_01145 [Actinobacteria bacterium]|nr:hypothetical protein [Actinomycetota bacterium]